MAEDPEPDAGRSEDTPSIGAEVRAFSAAFRHECAALRDEMDRLWDEFFEGTAEMRERMDAILAAQAKAVDLLTILIDRRAWQQTSPAEGSS
ncbi:hypothetical protein ACWDO0_27865 [Nocardia rhamnosiphila]